MSARLLEDFAQISCDWFWEMDENFAFSYFSHRWSEVFGRTPEQEIGKSRIDLALNSDDTAFWQPHLADLYAHRQFRDLIYPYRFEDGEIRWLKVSGQPAFDEAGVFTGYRGVGTDITEEHEAKRRLSETLEELRRTNRAFTLVNAELQRQNRRLVEQEKEISAQTTRLSATLDNMHQGLLMLDRELTVTAFNSKFVQLLGLSPQVVQEGATARELLDQAFQLGHSLGHAFEDMYARWLRRLSRRESSVRRQLLADGRVLSVAYVPMADGGWVITYEDVSEREKAEVAIREQRHQLDAALNNMAHGLCMFDDDFRLIVHNARYVELMRLPCDAIQSGVTLKQILQLNVEVGNLTGPAEKHYQEYLTELNEHGSVSFERDLLDGRTIAIKQQRSSNGGWVATYEDITEQKRAEAKILQLAREDALTNLPNRRLFGEKLNEALARARRGEAVTLFCLDLDHFKTVNDTLGHSAGDELLKTVAKRLQDCVRETDTVARLGGDEFAVLLAGLERDESSIVADRIIESLGAPYQLEGHPTFIGASIGAASAPHDAVDADTLLKNADKALYHAKEEGRGRCRFFVATMDDPLQRRRNIEANIRNTLQRGGLELFNSSPLLPSVIPV